MRIIRLRQRTRQWHEWRRQRIGSSDAPAILGVGYVSAAELLREKLGARREVTFAMGRGNRKESRALQLFAEEYGTTTRPACVEHDVHPWLSASLDGMDFWRRFTVEVKCLTVEKHEMALEGIVPPEVYPQLQHQLYVTSVPLCYYVSFTEAKRFATAEKPDSIAVVEVLPNVEYQQELFAAEEAFFGQMMEAWNLIGVTA